MSSLPRKTSEEAIQKICAATIVVVAGTSPETAPRRKQTLRRPPGRKHSSAKKTWSGGLGALWWVGHPRDGALHQAVRQLHRGERDEPRVERPERVRELSAVGARLEVLDDLDRQVGAARRADELGRGA